MVRSNTSDIRPHRKKTKYTSLYYKESREMQASTIHRAVAWEGRKSGRKHSIIRARTRGTGQEQKKEKFEDMNGRQHSKGKKDSREQNRNNRERSNLRIQGKDNERKRYIGKKRNKSKDTKRVLKKHKLIKNT